MARIEARGCGMIVSRCEDKLRKGKIENEDGPVRGERIRVVGDGSGYLVEMSICEEKVAVNTDTNCSYAGSSSCRFSV